MVTGWFSGDDWAERFFSLEYLENMQEWDTSQYTDFEGFCDTYRSTGIVDTENYLKK